MSVDTITAEYIGCNLAELILRHEERGRSQPRRPPPLATAPSWRRIFAGNVGGVRVLCGQSTNHLPAGPRTTVVAKSPSSARDIISTLGIGNFNASEGIALIPAPRIQADSNTTNGSLYIPFLSGALLVMPLLSQRSVPPSSVSLHSPFGRVRRPRPSDVGSLPSHGRVSCIWSSP